MKCGTLIFISTSITDNYGIKYVACGRNTFSLLYEISTKERNREGNFAARTVRENLPQNRTANYGERKLFTALVTKRPAFYRV